MLFILTISGKKIRRKSKTARKTDSSLNINRFHFRTSYISFPNIIAYPIAQSLQSFKSVNAIIVSKNCIFPNTAYIIKKNINDSEWAIIIRVHFTLNLTRHKSHTKLKTSDALLDTTALSSHVGHSSSFLNFRTWLQNQIHTLFRCCVKTIFTAISANAYYITRTYSEVGNTASCLDTLNY
jgi:hypothetical protein